MKFEKNTLKKLVYTNKTVYANCININGITAEDFKNASAVQNVAVYSDGWERLYVIIFDDNDIIIAVNSTMPVTQYGTVAGIVEFWDDGAIVISVPHQPTGKEDLT